MQFAASTLNLRVFPAIVLKYEIASTPTPIYSCPGQPALEDSSNEELMDGRGGGHPFTFAEHNQHQLCTYRHVSQWWW